MIEQFLQYLPGVISMFILMGVIAGIALFLFWGIVLDGHFLPSERKKK
jgi:hypothetical protein